MAQAGSLGQPLLIPLSMAGSLGGQGGLAVLTLPTTNVATLPGLTAATTAGNLLKLPLAGLQGTVLVCMLDYMRLMIMIWLNEVSEEKRYVRWSVQ